MKFDKEVSFRNALGGLVIGWLVKQVWKDQTPSAEVMAVLGALVTWFIDAAMFQAKKHFGQHFERPEPESPDLDGED